MHHPAPAFPRRFVLTLLGAAATIPGMARAAVAGPPKPKARSMSTIHYCRQKVGEVEVFYREAGPADAPVILLLHGFPSSSHMFRDLIPELANRFRVIAPDLPGFGQTKAPPRGQFTYSFDALADVVGAFVDAIGLSRYALYIFDYGAPVGLRLAMRHPERIAAIISQNGNAYLEGFSGEWGAWQTYWREPTDAHREACRPSLSPNTIRNWQYGTGTDLDLLSPDGYELDIAYMARPGAEEIQLDLILDYCSNVALYPPSTTIFARTSRRSWRCGADMIRRSSPRAPRPTNRTCRVRRFISWMQAISRWKRTTARSPAMSASSSGEYPKRRDQVRFVASPSESESTLGPFAVLAPRTIAQPPDLQRCLSARQSWR